MTAVTGQIVKKGLQSGVIKEFDITPPARSDEQVQESVGDTLAAIRKRRGRASTILTGAGGLGEGGATVARTQLLGG